jgi:hypothetical protein
MRSSLYVCYLVGLFFLGAYHYYQNWENGLETGDTSGYYFWLPSAFIYHDLPNPEITNRARCKAFGKPEIAMSELWPEGVRGDVVLNKYTMGMAVLYAPFFAAAHVLAPVWGYEADGFSMIYRYMIYLSGVVYGFLGLLVLRRVLLRYFDDTVTAWTLVAVGLATNLYFFASWNTAMCHAGQFLLFASLMYCTEKWYENPRLKYAIGVGALAGLITLIRPSDALCVAIPLFWGLTSISALRARFQVLKKHWTHGIAAVCSAIAVGFPQLLFWKIYTGTFFYYSYGSEGFDFSNPHLLEGIFGYQNGWLTYTPVMYLAILGIAWLFRVRNNYLLPVILILPVQLYVIYSYWGWQWTNGYGARPMIEYYALLSVPLAGFLSVAFARRWSRWPVMAVVVIFAVFSIFQEWQFHQGLIWPELGTRNFFYSTIGKTKLDAKDLLYFDGAPVQPADPAALIKVKTLYFNDFEDSTAVEFTRTDPYAGQFSFCFNQAQQFSPGLAVEPVGPEVQPGRWLKVSVWCMRKHDSGNIYKMSSLVTYFGHEGKELAYYGIRLENKPGNTEGSIWAGKPGVWAEVAYYVPVPKNIRESDLLKVYVWNPNETMIYIDNLSVELYK